MNKNVIRGVIAQVNCMLLSATCIECIMHVYVEPTCGPQTNILSHLVKAGVIV